MLITNDKSKTFLNVTNSIQTKSNMQEIVKTLALTCWPGKLLHTTCVRAPGSFDFYQDATASMKTLARKKEWEFPTHPFIDKNFAPLSLDETNQNVWI